MAEVYTPTTAEIRSGYAREDAIPPGIVRRLWAQFDRWLAEHDREVRALGRKDVLDLLEGDEAELSREYRARLSDDAAPGSGS